MASLNVINLYGGRFDGRSGVSWPSNSNGVGLRDQETGIVHDYNISDEWTAYFGKRTAIPSGFPGKPPREKAAA